MQYLIKVLTGHNQLEPIEAFLNSFAYIFSVELFPKLESKDTLITIYCDKKHAQSEIFDTLCSFAIKNEISELIDISKDVLEDKDWQESWKMHFKPIITDKLAIGISEDELKNIDKVKVIIDPGMAFGNGSHPTTKGCLIMIDKYFKKGMKVLDFGAGSGILAIACGKLGASEIDAIDNDELAVSICDRNVKKNKVKVKACSSDKFIIKKDYNFIIANITVDVIIQYFKYFTDGQTTLKYVLLSGISDYRKSQMDLFLNTEGLVPFDIYEEDGWYTYLLVINMGV